MYGLEIASLRVNQVKNIFTFKYRTVCSNYIIIWGLKTKQWCGSQNKLTMLMEICKKKKPGWGRERARKRMGDVFENGKLLSAVAISGFREVIYTLCTIFR